jgi:SIR2-like domain
MLGPFDVNNVPKDLAGSLQDRTLVPFVGAGVSASVLAKDGDPAFPSWRGLLERAAQRLREEDLPKKANLVQALIGDDDFLGAAEKAKEALGARWIEFLRRNFDPAFEKIDARSLDLATSLWHLGSSLIVTTNYDKVLNWACPASQRNDLRHWTSVDRSNLALLQQGTPAKPTIWHLHGFIEKPEEIILTPDGYRLLYPDVTNVKASYEAALSTLRYLLTGRPFLFAGFSMEEALRNQIQWVRETFAGGGRTHYVLARERDRSRFEQELKGLSVQVIPFEDFGEPLLRLLRQLAESVGSNTSAVISISGAPELAQQARSLEAKREDKLLDRVAAIYRVKGSELESTDM